MTARRETATHRRNGAQDAGVTLIELVVTMAIMGIFLTIFTGAILSMYRTTNKAESLLDSSAQIHTAFSRLDTSVRYASAVSLPGTDTSDNPSVAFETSYTGTLTCTQLRLDLAQSQLQQRTWTLGEGGATTPTAWRPLASSVGLLTQSGATVQPFETIQPTTQPGQVAPPQQLRVRLASTSGLGQSASTSQTDITFVAFNSAGGAGTSTACSAVIVP